MESPIFTPARTWQRSRRSYDLQAPNLRFLRVPEDCGTLQEAVDRAQDGDRIVVGVGRLRERVVVQAKSLVIEAAPGVRPRVEAPVGVALTVRAGAMLTVRGMDWLGGVATADGAGNAVVACGSRLTMKNCQLHGGEGYAGVGAAGLSAHSARSLRLENCVIEGGPGLSRRRTLGAMNGGAGLRASHCGPVVVTLSHIVGGAGSDADEVRRAGQGSPAIELTHIPHASFRLVRAIGGRDGHVNSPDSGSAVAGPGSGGPGLLARHGSRIVARALTLRAGGSEAPALVLDEISALLAENRQGSARRLNG